jgi:hypothetical protein
MVNVSLTVLDLTEISTSGGLERELKLALYLIDKGHVRDRQLVLICAHHDRIAVLDYLERKFGLDARAVLVVGDPAAEEDEFRKLAAYACAA